MVVKLNELDALVDSAQALIANAEEAINANILGFAPGAQRVQGQLALRFLEHMASIYPPQPWRTPSGETVVVSPYVAALEYVDGGKELLRAAAAAMQQSLEAMGRIAP